MQNARDEHAWLIAGSLMVLATIGLGVALIYTRTVMIPFVIAAFIVSLVSPVVDYQVVRLRLPRSLAVFATLLIVLAVIAVAFFVLVAIAQTVVATADRYSDSLSDLGEQLSQRAEEWGIHWDPDAMMGGLRSNVPRLLTQSVGTAVSFLSTAFLVSIFVIFLLAGRNPYTLQKGIYAEIDQQIRRYIATKVVLSAITGVLVWGVLALFGLQLAHVFGVLAFLLNFIPSIGSAIATLLPIPIAVAQFGGSPWMVLGVVAVPGAIQMIIGNGIEPKLFGNELQLHPVTVILALAFWGLLWGLAGAILAVPITAVIRIVLMRFETVRPLGRLLAGELPGTPIEADAD